MSAARAGAMLTMVMLLIIGRIAAAEPLPLRAIKLKDSQGKTHSPGDWVKAKGVVLFFLGTECPVSNGYCPEMTRLEQKYAGQGIIIVGVHPDPDVDAAAAARHAREYGLKFPVLLDPEQQLAAAGGVQVVPEAVLLAATGEVLYRGRIDDRYTAEGVRRDQPRNRDLALALDAHLAGKKPPVAQTKAFGCPLPAKRRTQENH